MSQSLSLAAKCMIREGYLADRWYLSRHLKEVKEQAPETISDKSIPSRRSNCKRKKGNVRKIAFCLG